MQLLNQDQLEIEEVQKQASEINKIQRKLSRSIAFFRQINPGSVQTYQIIQTYSLICGLSRIKSKHEYNSSPSRRHGLQYENISLSNLDTVFFISLGKSFPNILHVTSNIEHNMNIKREEILGQSIFTLQPDVVRQYHILIINKFLEGQDNQRSPLENVEVLVRWQHVFITPYLFTLSFCQIKDEVGVNIKLRENFRKSNCSFVLLDHDFGVQNVDQAFYRRILEKGLGANYQLISRLNFNLMGPQVESFIRFM